MGPIFMFCAILCICAGFDLVDLPGTQTLNLILNGGKIGNDQVTFDAHSGYHFPILNKAKPVFYKLFNGQMGVKNGDKLYQDNQGSYNDAASK
jgi:hypothetical protein